MRLEVHDSGSGERIEVDLGVDVRIAAPVTTDIGRVLSLEELAADKDAGFALARFAEALAALHRFPDADWDAHDAERQRITRIFDEWRAEITA